MIYLWAWSNFLPETSIKIETEKRWKTDFFTFEIKAGLQRAKKVVSDNPELVDFAIGLVNSVFNLPDGQMNFCGGNSN